MDSREAVRVAREDTWARYHALFLTQGPRARGLRPWPSAGAAPQGVAAREAFGPDFGARALGSVMRRDGRGERGPLSVSSAAPICRLSPGRRRPTQGVESLLGAGGPP